MSRLSFLTCESRTQPKSRTHTAQRSQPLLAQEHAGSWLRKDCLCLSGSRCLQLPDRAAIWKPSLTLHKHASSGQSPQMQPSSCFPSNSGCVGRGGYGEMGQSSPSKSKIYMSQRHENGDVGPKEGLLKVTIGTQTCPVIPSEHFQHCTQGITKVIP